MEKLKKIEYIGSPKEYRTFWQDISGVNSGLEIVKMLQ